MYLSAMLFCRGAGRVLSLSVKKMTAEGFIEL